MNEKENFAKNLKHLREKQNIEQLELAHHLGRKSASSVSEWEKGKYTPKAGTLRMIADYFHVSLSDLMGKDLTTNPTNIHEVSNFINIPILGQIACGDPITAEENIIGYLQEPADSLPTGNIFALSTVGNSMSPTIPEGSSVIIREQPDVEQGEIAAVLVNGDSEATLKRVKKQGDIVMLIADNPEYPPYIVTEDNPARILGKAIKFTTNL